MTETAKIAPGKAAQKASRGKARLVIKAGSAGRAKVKTFQFGTARLTVSVAAQGDWAHNVDLGQSALKKIKSRLVKPGVKLRGMKSAPLFHADPSNPRQLIRELNGKRERGVFENGVFKVTA